MASYGQSWPVSFWPPVCAVQARASHVRPICRQLLWLRPCSECQPEAAVHGSLCYSLPMPVKPTACKAHSQEHGASGSPCYASEPPAAARSKPPVSMHRAMPQPSSARPQQHRNSAHSTHSQHSHHSETQGHPCARIPRSLSRYRRPYASDSLRLSLWVVFQQHSTMGARATAGQEANWRTM